MKPRDAQPDARGRLVCPQCKGPVTEPYQQGGKMIRRHKERLKDGKLCEYGRGEGDDVG